ncbi:hypothetical protein BHM03_00036092 [Ensete ventricosum]|nr:hypothetical protein BHM03_00036092 [Ensete ventricosum]
MASSRTALRLLWGVPFLRASHKEEEILRTSSPLGSSSNRYLFVGHIPFVIIGCYSRVGGIQVKKLRL